MGAKTGLSAQENGNARSATIAAILASPAVIHLEPTLGVPALLKRPASQTRWSVAAAASAGLALAVLVPLGAGVRAEEPANPEDAKRRLESQRKELQRVQERTQTLQGDMESIEAERARLNIKLMETAGLIKKSEGQLTAIESRLGELEAQEKILKGSLAQRHDQIAKLLSALQRMGRNPPPVLVTRREDALEMVRSAMLLAAAFPELGDQARELATKLNDLVRVMTEIRTQGEQLKAEMTRLKDARTRLSGLMEAKRVSLEEHQSELKQMRVAAAQISSSVDGLNDLIAKLDQAVKDNTGLGKYEQKQRAEAAADQRPVVVTPPSAGSAPQQQMAEKAPPSASPPSASGQPAAKGPQVAELTPGARLGNPGRIEPEIAFDKAKGLLPLPVQGKRVLAYGEKTQFGGHSKGVVLETRQGAQVTSPCDGWIVYAGEFRSYGQLLIINAGGGYHVLLAGLSQIDVQPGQFVLATEPVGTMSGWPQLAQPAAANSAPVLYVEFREEGRPIDPDPWWVKGDQKVQG